MNITYWLKRREAIAHVESKSSKHNPKWLSLRHRRQEADAVRKLIHMGRRKVRGRPVNFQNWEKKRHQRDYAESLALGSETLSHDERSVTSSKTIKFDWDSRGHVHWTIILRSVIDDQTSKVSTPIYKSDKNITCICNILCSWVARTAPTMMVPKCQ